MDKTVDFKLVQGADSKTFETDVNQHLEDDYLFAGNIVHTEEGWTIPMIKFVKEDAKMESRIAKQIWGMFIARLF